MEKLLYSIFYRVSKTANLRRVEHAAIQLAPISRLKFASVYILSCKQKKLVPVGTWALVFIIKYGYFFSLTTAEFHLIVTVKELPYINKQINV